MSDNAASRDGTNSEVHPDTRAGTDSNTNNEDREREMEAAVEFLAKDDIAEETGSRQDDQRECEKPPQPSASPPPAPPPIKSPTPPTSAAPVQASKSEEELERDSSGTNEPGPPPERADEATPVMAQGGNNALRPASPLTRSPTLESPAPASTSIEHPGRETSRTEEPAALATSTEDTAPIPAQEEGNDASQGQEPLFMNTGDDAEGLDPDTLANLAALSRLARDEGDGDEDDENEGASGGDNDFSTLLGDSQHSMTREQMQDIVARLAQHGDDDQDAEGEDDLDMDAEGEDEYPEEQGGDGLKHKREHSEDLREVDDSKGAKDEGGDPKSDRRRKRKRNRTVLSCTECHRRCDRNIPCSRCIRRGVPGMCHMDTPILPMRKKKKRSELHITHELRMRVQALEQLIKSGLTLDSDQATFMATETVHQATRAAQSGSQDATNALAQLTRSSIGSGIGGMSSEAQNMLLMDVLQQLSGQVKAREVEEIAEEPEDGQGAWSTVPHAPAVGVPTSESPENAEASSSKIDLTLPGFREDSGKIFIPPTVRHVEKQLRNERILLLEPLPIQGLESFLDVGNKLAYGADSPAYRKERICAVQSFSTTGALRLASSFLARFPPTSAGRAIYVPNPTLPEDLVSLKASGMEIRHFRFQDQRLGGVDWEGLREDLMYAPLRSAVLLHVSGSAPTGAEFTAPQWRHLTTILLERQMIPLVIMTSQGLSSGDVNRDAQPLRFMIHEGVPVVLVQSFDTMMGIYTDSPSIVSVVVRNMEEKSKVNSQLRMLAREMYLHPSPWGAHVVHAILSNPKLYTAWLNEIKAMADRLRSVRDKLFDVIANKLKTPGSWLHIKRATGMYCSTLLPPSQCDALYLKRNIHILPEGCVSLGALNAPKIDQLARGIDLVVREGIKEAEEARKHAIAMELALQAAKEQAAREEAEAQAALAAAEEERAREQDTLMMEESIASAMEAQKRMEEEEKMREEADREMVETLRKAEERAAIARQAEAILASITGGEL